MSIRIPRKISITKDIGTLSILRKRRARIMFVAIYDVNRWSRSPTPIRPSSPELMRRVMEALMLYALGV